MGPGPGTNSETRTKVCPQCKSRFDAESKICPKDGTILVFEAGELSIGTLIAGKYEVKELIGRGASGSVYRAYQAGQNRDVAIKLLKLDFVSDEESLKRFELEAKATAKLSHPNIAAIYDHGCLPNGQPYMICEYLNGKTLRDVLKRHKLFAAAEAIEICTQVCDAMSAAHDRGIVHRDIKPANIMLCVDGNEHAIVKLIDFGMAKILRGHKGNTLTLGLTQTGDILGTPYYMSPEQALGQPVDWRADIYGLGCVLFEMVSGSVPFHGSSEYEVIDKHVHGLVPALPPHIVVPDQVPAVIKRSLAKTPDLRYNSAQEMKDELLGRQISQASKARGSMLRGISAAGEISTSVRKGGIDQFIPFLILLILAIIGFYIFSVYQGWVAPPAVPSKPSTSTAAPPTTPVTAPTAAPSGSEPPPANPHELPQSLQPIKFMPTLNDQVRFCEDYAAKHGYEYGTEHQLAMLYSNFDERKAMQHIDTILQHSIYEPHILAHVAGGEDANSKSIGKVYLTHHLEKYADLPYLHAACLLKLGELRAANGELKEATSLYTQVAEGSKPDLRAYAVLAKQKLQSLQSRPPSPQKSPPPSTPQPAASQQAAPQPTAPHAEGAP